MILKECEDEDGYKGGGYVREIFKTDEEFQRSMVEFVMESFEVNIFSKDMMEMHLEPKLITLNSKKRTSLKSSRE